MQINIKPDGSQTVVNIIGNLDIAATTNQTDLLQQVLDIADRQLVIDCAELEYISSAGLRFLMQLNRESEAKGGKVTICHLNEDVSDIFRMSGFHNIFEIVQ